MDTLRVACIQMNSIDDVAVNLLRAGELLERAAGLGARLALLPENFAFMGADDAEPILGVTPLESVGIEVDPRNQTLKRLPAARLK